MSRTKTARDILEAIADGERDPETLAALAHGGVKGGHAAVRQALDGMALGGHHPRLIRIHVDHVTLLDRSVAAIEDEIEAALDAIEGAWGINADGVPSPARARPPWPPPGGSRRSPASAPTSPGRSSPKQAWT
jgi:hypothetical protein